MSQKNSGTSYVLTVHKNLDASPGHHTENFRLRKDIKRNKRAAYAKTINFKRRRHLLFDLHKRKMRDKERKEGITYSSGCNFYSSNIDKSIVQKVWHVPEKMSIVYFDLETTGLSKTSEIVQISAKCETMEFNEYIVPSTKIPKVVTTLTGDSF